MRNLCSRCMSLTVLFSAEAGADAVAAVLR